MRRARDGGKGQPGDGLFDRELDHLPHEARWREWMNRVEATIFAASERSAETHWRGSSASPVALICGSTTSGKSFAAGPTIWSASPAAGSI